MDKNDILLNIYDMIITKMTALYLSHLETQDIATQLDLGLLPTNQVKDKITNFVQLNTIGDTEILRINLDCQIFSMRSKHLYNKTTKESIINLIDFSINKIQLRSGGFGTRMVNCCYDLQRKQLEQHLQIKKNKTKMFVFKFLALPFQIKSGFKFKWMSSDIICHKENDWNILYKLFKMFVLMNKTLDLGQHVPKYNIFSLEIAQIGYLINKQIRGYYRKMYNDSLQIKDRMIDHIDTKCCEEFSTNSLDFCNKIIYANICNQLSHDRLCDIGIMNILQELFYLEKIVGN